MTAPLPTPHELARAALSAASSHLRAAQTAARRHAHALSRIPQVPPDAPGSDPRHRERSRAILRAAQAGQAYVAAAALAEWWYWEALDTAREVLELEGEWGSVGE